MLKLFSVVLLWRSLSDFGVFASPTINSDSKQPFNNDIHFQDAQSILLSIEGKLKNLENSITTCNRVGGKIDYYGRKIDNIEKNLSRFQEFMQVELNKISENISGNNFKNDITKDHTIRKIDVVYQQIHHKLGSIEGQMNVANVKSQNIKGIIINKLDKIEENLAKRDADIEAELVDAVAAIDDLKTTCTTMEEDILNATKESEEILRENTETNINKFYADISHVLNDTNIILMSNIFSLRNSMETLINSTTSSTNIITIAREQIDENMNAYANKFVDMYWNLWKTTDSVDNQLLKLAQIVNTTRNEQKNNFRTLTIQVARASGNLNFSDDCPTEYEKLEELSQKIDSNFDNVILSQNLFLESCHRVQMDEAQLESQISLVLNKLIDIFQSKTSVGPKDVEYLANHLHKLDENDKTSSKYIAHLLSQIISKITNLKTEVMGFLNNENLKIESMHEILKDMSNFKDDNIKDNTLKILKMVQKHLFEATKKIETSISHYSKPSNIIDTPLITEAKEPDVEKLLEEIYGSNTEKTQIQTSLKPSTTESKEQDLDKLLGEIFGGANTEKPHIQTSHKPLTTESKEQDLDKLLGEIFGGATTAKTQIQTSHKPSTIESKEQDLDKLLGEIFGGATTAKTQIQTSDKPPIIGTNDKDLDKLLGEIFSKTTTETTNMIDSDDCLPDYSGLLDIRIKDDDARYTKCNKQTAESNESKQTTEQDLDKLLGAIFGTSTAKTQIQTSDKPPITGMNEHDLDNILQEIFGGVTTSKSQDLDKLLGEIFGKTTTEITNMIDTDECLPDYSGLMDVRIKDDDARTIKCNKNTAESNKSKQTTETIPEQPEEVPNSTECLPDYSGLLDIRIKDDDVTYVKCNTKPAESNESKQTITGTNEEDLEKLLGQIFSTTTTETSITDSDDCLPDYSGLLDIRIKDDDAKYTKCNKKAAESNEQDLDKLLGEIFGGITTAKTQIQTSDKPPIVENNEQDLDKLLGEIFGKKTTETTNTIDSDDCLPDYSGLLDIRIKDDDARYVKCNKNTVESNESKQSTETIPEQPEEVPNSTECEPDYSGLLDIRIKDDDAKYIKCNTNTAESNEPKQTMTGSNEQDLDKLLGEIFSETKTDEPLPNYINLIDVRVGPSSSDSQDNLN